MGKSTKPYPLGKTVAVGFALAATFLLLSLFFLFLQARSTHVRLTGEVIAVAADTITIRSARGSDTVLTFVSDTELRGVTSIAAIAQGQHVMIRGNFSKADQFQVDGLRVIKDRDRK